MTCSFWAPFGLLNNKLVRGARVTIASETGFIVETQSEVAVQPNDETTDGVLIPGFINAHTHLELSNLEGVIPQGTGMVGFLQSILALRRDNILPDDLYQRLYDSGTVGVGDISNVALTAPFKAKHSDVFFHTFVEVLGVRAENAEAVFDRARAVADEFTTPVSVTPHTPFTVSDSLARLCVEKGGAPLSVHLLESQAERFWLDGYEGEITAFLENAGFANPPNPEKTALLWALKTFPQKTKIGFVHCTEFTEEELRPFAAYYSNSFFVLCPRANEYINRRLPYMPYFQRFVKDRVCIGTDSLSSNTSLEPLEELKLLKKRFPFLKTEDLLIAATYNGARFLGVENKLGVLREGIRPGLLCIRNISAEGDITETSCLQRYI